MPDRLKSPGAILLVSCYELGHQPLSIASPLALLRQAGYRPSVLDLAAERLDPEAVTRARVIAIAVPMHTALRIGVAAAQRMRALNPDALLCVYGLYATLNAASLLERTADAVIGGEYEEPLVRLVEALETPPAGAPEPRRFADRLGRLDVPGVGTRARAAAPWLRKIPFAVPERASLRPLESYARLEHDGESLPAGHVEASRGCLHLCRHCPIPPVYGGRFFVVPQEIVLADLRNQVAAGVRHITFGDPDFLNGPGHTMEIVRRLHAEFPRLTFDITAKIEHLLAHGDLLPELAQLGCLFVVSAVESLSDEVLAILDKGHRRSDVVGALRLTRAAGISLRPSFVPFTPWAGLSDYEDLLRFVEDEDLIEHLDPVQLSIRLLVPPGSLLAGHPAMRPFLGPLDPERFTYGWAHPDPRLDRLQKEVAALAGMAARDRIDPASTFAAIVGRAAAHRAGSVTTIEMAPRPVAAFLRDDRPAPIQPAPPRRDKGRPPRLSEPWFC